MVVFFFWYLSLKVDLCKLNTDQKNLIIIQTSIHLWVSMTKSPSNNSLSSHTGQHYWMLIGSWLRAKCALSAMSCIWFPARKRFLKMFRNATLLSLIQMRLFHQNVKEHRHAAINKVRWNWKMIINPKLLFTASKLWAATRAILWKLWKCSWK